MNQAAQRVDPRRYLEPLWRRRWLVLAVLILVPGAAYGVSKLVTPKYEASTTLLVRSTNFSSQAFTQQLSVATGSASAAAKLVQTTPVATEASRILGDAPPDPGELLDSITVTTDDTDTTSQFMTITATSDDPDRAADIADAFARAITRTRTENAVAEIDKTIETLQGQQAGDLGDRTLREELSSQLQQLRGLRASQQGTTQVIEPAIAPGSPVSPRPLRNTILAFLAALVLAAILVPLADRFSRKLRHPEELEGANGAQLLAMIPESAFPGKPPSVATKESFQTLRASLRYFNLDRSLSLVLVTSPAHDDGKTTVSTNLALAMARDGGDVVLLDADLRRPQAARRLGLEGGYGVEAAIVDGVPLSKALQEVDAGGDTTLNVLASVDPSPNPAALLGSSRMRELLAELAELHDTVIIDTPPVLAVADAVPLLSVASGVVLVSRLNQTGVDSILRTSRIVKSAEGRLLGNVATGVPESGGLYNYGSYGYGYEYAAPRSSS